MRKDLLILAAACGSVGALGGFLLSGDSPKEKMDDILANIAYREAWKVESQPSSEKYPIYYVLLTLNGNAEQFVVVARDARGNTRVTVHPGSKISATITTEDGCVRDTNAGCSIYRADTWALLSHSAINLARQADPNF